MKKLMLNDKEVVVGDWLESEGDFEGGNVVDIDHENQLVSLYDGREGWFCSEEFGNFGKLKFV